MLEISLGDIRHSADVLSIELYNILDGWVLPEDLRNRVQQLAEYVDSEYCGSYKRVSCYNDHGEPQICYVALDDNGNEI